MYITNESTGETLDYSITTVYTGLKLNGEYYKSPANGVRYVTTKYVNDDIQYYGLTFSMYYTVEYKDGHVVTSTPKSIEVK